MKILIEIPPHVYEHAKECSEDSKDEFTAIRAIANGTPIPDGRWRLIDVNNLMQKIEKEHFKLK